MRRDLVGPLPGAPRPPAPVTASADPVARGPSWLARDPAAALEAEWEHWRSGGGVDIPEAANAEGHQAVQRGDRRPLEKLAAKPGHDKHHKIELVVLEGYPSVFTSADLNRPGDLVNVDASSIAASCGATEAASTSASMRT